MCESAKDGWLNVGSASVCVNAWWHIDVRFNCMLLLCCVCRAFYSLRKVGIEADDVRMAVCVMRVVPARYAFVIHTKNPSNNDANEVRMILCRGCLGAEQWH